MIDNIGSIIRGALLKVPRLCSQQLIYRSRSSNSSSSISSFAYLSVFDAPQQFKSVLGRRVLVVTEDNDVSREQARRMWYSMQKNGKDSVNFSVCTLFPSVKEVRGAVDFSRRAGVDSVLAIGDPLVLEHAKAIREALETGTIMLPIAEDSGDAPPRSVVTIPLVLAPTTPSAWTAYPIWNCLNAEEDFVQQARCRNADLVIFDESLTEVSEQFDLGMVRHHTLCLAFDLIFAHTVNHAFELKMVSPALEDSLTKKMTPLLRLLDGSSSLRSVMKFNEELSGLHAYLLSKHPTKTFDPSIQLTEQLSLLRMLHGPFQKDELRSINQSWLAVDIFRRILENDTIFLAGDANEACESKLVRNSFLSVIKILNLYDKSYRDVTIEETKKSIGLLNKKAQEYLSSGFTSASMSAAGAMEGLVFIEESTYASHIKVQQSLDRNILKRHIKPERHRSIKLDFLRSDFLFDIVDRL